MLDQRRGRTPPGRHARHAGHPPGPSSAARRVVADARELAGAHEVRLATGGNGGTQVARRIADRRHLVGEIDAVALGDLREQAGQRFAGAAVLRGVRAENTASTRRRAGCSSWFIFTCMALTAAMSNSPRPMPDWLVAMTVCQPAWLRRAIASSAPGSGNGGSSAALTKSSRSSLIVPSRSRTTSFSGVTAASLDRSATRFIAACRPMSSASRLARSAASSALTMTPSKNASTGARSDAQFAQRRRVLRLSNRRRRARPRSPSRRANSSARRPCAAGRRRIARRRRRPSSGCWRCACWPPPEMPTQAGRGTHAPRPGASETSAQHAGGSRPRPRCPVRGGRRRAGSRSAGRAGTASAPPGLRLTGRDDGERGREQRRQLESGRSRSISMRITPSACRRSANGSLSPDGLLADPEQAGERLELVGERDGQCRSRRAAGVAGEARPVVVLDRPRDGLGLPAVVARSSRP